MTPEQQSAMRQALEALEEIAEWYGHDLSVGSLASSMYEASCLAKVQITALRRALEQQPVDEPVAFFDPQERGFYWAKPTNVDVPMTIKVEPMPLFATPPDIQAKVAELEAENAKLRSALENCRLLAARHRKEDWALLTLGFCAEGGVIGSITR